MSEIDLNKPKPKKGVIREYIEALVTAVLLAFVIRSFVVEPFKIPSKSMVPTLLVGDHIFVNKFAYGLRIPWTKKWFVQFADPHRGDVIVFIYPEDESLDFIKRVVGEPGDKIRFQDGKLYVNDSEIKEEDISITGINRKDKRLLAVSKDESEKLPEAFSKIPFSRGFENYKIQLEDLTGKEHLIQRSLLIPNND